MHEHMEGALKSLVKGINVEKNWKVDNRADAKHRGKLETA